VGVFALGWVVPVIVWSGAAVGTLWWLIKRSERSDRREPGPTRTIGSLAGEFWRFSTPRAFAGFFQVVIFSLDTLLIGALRSTGEAAVYAAAGRVAVMSAFALSAIGFALSPQIAHLLTRGDSRRAETVFQSATWWVMALSWPVSIVLVVWAPLLVRVFGHQFHAASGPLAVISLGMLVQVGTGNNSIVILMGGKSGWNLASSAIALAVNVALNLALIPHFGIMGAAWAWTITMAVDNGITTWVMVHYLKLRPFGSGYPYAALAPVVCFGVLGVLVREIVGQTIPVFVVTLAASTILYALVVWRLRDTLHLNIFRGMLKVRRLMSTSTSFETATE
jgi:O-antigen/teichoic acid export membrane protein